VYEFEDRGHFTEDDGCSEFPELLVEILTDVNK
jgi:predicted alpha/beta hydrolase family esterase